MFAYQLNSTLGVKKNKIIIYSHTRITGFSFYHWQYFILHGSGHIMAVCFLKSHKETVCRTKLDKNEHFQAMGSLMNLCFSTAGFELTNSVFNITSSDFCFLQHKLYSYFSHDSPPPTPISILSGLICI